MIFRGFTCLWLVHLLVSSCARSVAQLERLESPATECKQNEFYYAPREACKSCSDLRILLYGGPQEDQWMQNGDAINLKKPQAENGVQPDRRQLPTLKPALELDLPPKFSAAPGSEVLSRLIGGQRYSMDPSAGLASSSSAAAAVASGDESGAEEEQSTLSTSEEAANPLGLDTLLAHRFVEGLLGSQLVRGELLGSIEQCKYFQNSSACQLWSNLCVLSLYSHSSTPPPPSGRQSRARSSNNLFTGTGNDHRSISGDRESPSTGSSGSGGARQQSAPSEAGQSQWWQQCAQELHPTTICDSLRSWWRVAGGAGGSDTMTNIFSTSDEEALSIKIAGSNPSLRLQQPIQLLAYKYSLDGKFIGADQFGLAEMEGFCPAPGSSGPSRSVRLDSNFIRAGTSMRGVCRFSSGQARLLARTGNETLFVDLYVAHQSGGNVFVKPVPVVIRNLLYNGQLVNQGVPHRYTDTSRLKVVHRFFQSSYVELASNQRVLVYAKSATLDLKFKAHERGVQLVSLAMVLDYAQLEVPNNSSHLTELKTDIVIAQNLVDMVRHKMDFELALTILSLASCIWSLLKSYNILRYQGVVKMDLYSLVRFLFVSCDTLANLLATCTLLFTGLLYLAFKLQLSSWHVLTPSQDLEESILTNTRLALLFKAAGLACKMYDLVQADLFFVDWERPKMLTSAEIQNHLSHYASKQETDDTSAMDPRLRGELHKELSFWRPYAVVDRWLQMQTMRRQNLALQLILFACLNDLLGLGELARSEPEWSLKRHIGGLPPEPLLQPTVSSAYRLLILATVYLLLAVAQLVWHRYFLETMIRDRVHEFVDLCSIGNVSLFCMLYPQFGYYVHGRNPNGSGDCSVGEMNGLLQREEQGLCSRRGLVPNTDEQVFVLVLPPLINQHYRKLLRHQQQQQVAHHWAPLAGKSELARHDEQLAGDLFDRSFFRSALNTASGRSHGFAFDRPFIESLVARRRVINVFLSNFLEHHYKDLDYSIREPRRFEGFLSGPELETTGGASGLLPPRPGVPTVMIGGAPEAPLAATKATPAVFYKDTQNSFTALLWLGLEWDLILVELLSLVLLDRWLQQSLYVSSVLLYSGHWLMKRFYQSMARNNVTFKALLDDKFLVRA